MSEYAFPGMPGFIERAAAAVGVTDPGVIDRARHGHHIDATALALSQLPRQASAFGPGCVAEVKARLASIRSGLALQLAAIDAATAEVLAAIEPDHEPVVKPEPRPELKPRGPRKPAGPEAVEES